MKNRRLLPPGIFEVSETRSVDRILARDFWGGSSGATEGEVVPLHRDLPSQGAEPPVSSLSPIPAIHNR